MVPFFASLDFRITTEAVCRCINTSEHFLKYKEQNGGGGVAVSIQASTS
jgi:hypothetical protein